MLPLRIELFGLAVKAPFTRKVVEQALLKSLIQELHDSWERVPVVVAERILAAQVCLREARYKAIRVLRGYFGDDDGYLMINAFEPVPHPSHARGGRACDESPVRG